MLNIAVLGGTLTKPPQVRSLPSGLSLACFDVQVHQADLPDDMVPVALFAGEGEVPKWAGGQELFVVGRVRRRFFRASGSTQSRTEVVAEQVLAIEQAGAVGAVLAQVTATLAGVLDDLGT